MDSIYYLADNQPLFLIVVALMTLFVGSFLNVVIHRLPIMMQREWGEECRIYLGLKRQPNEPEKMSLALPASHCPRCKHPIYPWHNIPVFSYLFLRGRCAFCHASISMRYPIVELLTCFMSVYIAWRFGFTWQTMAALVFTWICIALTFIDVDHHLLPDQLTLLLLWVGLYTSLFNVFTNSTDAILGAILGYLFFAALQGIFGYITGKTGMGQGDYKLLAALGAFLGWRMLPLILIVASMSGILFALTQMTIRQRYKSVPLPFGPYLAFAGWVALIWGNDITGYYLSLF